VPVPPDRQNLGLLVDLGSDGTSTTPATRSYVPADVRVDTSCSRRSGAWLKISEVIDFVRAVQPGRAYALPDALLHRCRAGYRRRPDGAPAGTRYARLTPEETLAESLDALADRLYQLAPDGFIRGRGDEAVERPVGG